MVDISEDLLEPFEQIESLYAKRTDLVSFIVD